MKLGIGNRLEIFGTTMLQLALVGVCFACAPSVLSGNDGPSDSQLAEAGLKVQWYSNAGLGVQGRLVNWELMIDENQATTFFTVKAGTYSETISENDLGPNGKPFGIEGALEYSNIRKEIIEAELAAAGRDQVEVIVVQEALPKSSLYTMNSDSSVRAFDAETGKLLWKTNIGDSHLPAGGVGADTVHVAVANGEMLYCLEAETGKVLWSHHCKSIITAPPEVADDYIYVPLFDGRVERVSISAKGFLSRVYVTKGKVVTQPLITPMAVVWGTAAGRISVAARWDESSQLAYELYTEREIAAKPAFKDGNLFAVSRDGFLYVIDEKRGSVIWEVSTGGAISQSPILLGNYVYVINERGEMFKFNAKNGDVPSGWDKPRTGVGMFVGASKNQMYVLDGLGDLKVYSQDTGTLVDSASVGAVERALPQLKSDRMYLMDPRGNVRCVREIASESPFYHSDEFLPEVKPPTGNEQPAEEKPAAAPGSNPFETNPFNQQPPAKQDDAGDGSNPFDQTPPANQGGNEGADASKGSGNPFDQ